MRRKPQLVADVYKAARMVGESSFHTYFGVRSMSRAELIVYRLLQSRPYKCIHLLRCSEVITSKQLSQLSVMVLDSRTLCHTKIVPYYRLCGKRSSFPIDPWLVTDEITRLQLQNGLTVERLSLYLKRWCHLTTESNTKASKRLTAKYYVGMWSNTRYLRLAD